LLESGPDGCNHISGIAVDLFPVKVHDLVSGLSKPSVPSQLTHSEAAVVVLAGPVDLGDSPELTPQEIDAPDELRVPDLHLQLGRRQAAVTENDPS